MAPADPEAKIPCPTPQHLQAELDALTAILALGEKEETWDKMEKALIRFAGVTRGGGYKHLPLFTDGIGRKGCASKVAECMLSDRGRLSTSAVEFLQAFAPRLGQQFAPVIQVYFEPLLKLFARPNKVFLKRSERCLNKILDNCHLPQIVLELRKGLNDDAVTCRRICSTGIERAISEWEVDVWTERSLMTLEEGLRRMATDKDAEVRQTGKRVWNKFMELWPERVDDFSAPLTPTIRRYLNLPAQGAAAKMKGKAKAVPAARSVPPVASSSSAAPAAVVDMAKPLRVAALTTKPSRPAQRSAAPLVEPHEPRHFANPPTITRREPSPKKISPKKLETRPTRPEAPIYAASIYRAPALGGTMPSRPDVGPNQGRSVSHSILPNTYSSTSLSESNHLSKPSRPLLPQSFSTTALPEASTGTSTQPPYVSRFATGPIRIVRPAPMASLDDNATALTMSADGFLYTPSGATVLGGPSRPPPHVHLGHGRKPTMGVAHRRVVTGPEGGAGLGYPARTPAASRYLSRNVKEKAAIEEADFPILGESGPNTDLDPCTPAPTTRVTFESPLLPIKRPGAPATELEAKDLRETSILVETLERLRDSESMVPVELAAQVPLPPDETVASQEGEGSVISPLSQDGVAALDRPVSPHTSPINEEQGERPPNPSVEMAELHPVSHPVSASSSVQDSQNPAALVAASPTAKIQEEARSVTAESSTSAHVVPTQHATASSPMMPVTIDVVCRELDPAVEASQPVAMKEVKLAAPMMAPAPAKVPGPTKIEIPVRAPSRAIETRAPIKPAPTVKPASASAPAPPRKPPVPRAAAISKVSKPIERKPFRPATAAQTAALTKSREVARPAVVENPAKPPTVEKPAVKEVPRSRQVSSNFQAGSTTSASQKVTTAASNTTNTTARSTKPSTLLAPTKASAMRAAPAVSHPKSTATTASTPSTSALPPIRKERIKLKPALPSFKPVRNATTQSRAVSATTSKMATSKSTTSIASRSKAAIVAKVKPQDMPLPPSPPRAPEDIALPSSPVEKPLVAKVRPVIKTPPAKPVEETVNEVFHSIQAANVPLPKSPIHVQTVEVVLPAQLPLPISLSRDLTTHTPAPAEVPLPASPIAHLAQLSDSTIDRDSAGPDNTCSALRPPSAQLDSQSGVDPEETGSNLSRNSPAPTMSDYDSNSDSEDDDEDLTGVTFKVKSDPIMSEGTNRIKPKVQQPIGDLMEFSAPSRKFVSTTPKYTPGRKALVIRDANVSSPLVKRGTPVEEIDEDDW